MEGTRRERRQGSRRARRRYAKEKAAKLVGLVERGASEQTIASSLGFTLQETRDLLDLVEESKASSG